jgi:hypothetical protein
VFLDTLASLATSAGTAWCLLPQRLQITIQKLLAKGELLQFDAVAAELLSAAASPACAMPFMVLYLSYTRSEAPQYARGLKAVMVDQQAYQAPGGHRGTCKLGLPLFCIEQLANAASRPAAAGPAVAGLQPAAVVASEPLQQQQQAPMGSSRRGALQRSDQADDLDADPGAGAASRHATGSFDDSSEEDPLASLAGASLLRTWVHWRLRCARARASARLHRQLTPLERLQQEAQAALRPAAVA